MKPDSVFLNIERLIEHFNEGSITQQEFTYRFFVLLGESCQEGVYEHCLDCATTYRYGHCECNCPLCTEEISHAQVCHDIIQQINKSLYGYLLLGFIDFYAQKSPQNDLHEDAVRYKTVRMGSYIIKNDEDLEFKKKGKVEQQNCHFGVEAYRQYQKETSHDFS
jgi:hypothetical protein